MKTRNLAALLAVTVLAACTEKVSPVRNVIPEDLKEVCFTAYIDAEDTKTNINSDLSVSWVLNDSIAVYDGTGIRDFYVSEVYDDGSAKISGSVASDASVFYAVYPAKAFAGMQDNNVQLNFPAAQLVPEGLSADPDALVSYAYATSADYALTFKNLTTIAKVTVSKPVSLITLRNNKGNITNGVLTVKVNGDEIPSAVGISGSSSVTLAAKDGKLGAGSYYIAMAPSEFPTGIALKADVEEGYILMSSSDSVAFVRNCGGDLGDITNNSKSVLAPFNIANAEDLATFSTYAPYYKATDVVTITADIDLGGQDWRCSNTSERYLGSIDGGKHRIYNYIIKSGAGTQNPGDAAVFGRIGQGNANYPYFIKDLAFGTKDYDFDTKTGTWDGVSKVTFASDASGSSYYYPGAIAYCYAYGTIENLANFTPVEITSACTAYHRGGALLGTVKANVTIKNCINFGDISDGNSQTAGAPTTGGLVGALDGANCVVDGCINKGNVTITSSQIGDCGGLMGYDNYLAEIKNCVNEGNVTVNHTLTKAIYVGGITSRCAIDGTTLNNCINKGNITVKVTGAADTYVGGVVARIQGVSVSDSSNEGKVTCEITNTGKKVYMAGFIGNAAGTASSIDNCHNSGNVSVSGSGTAAYAGGIMGYNAFELKVKNSSNSGNITSSYVGTDNNGGCAGIIMFTNKIVNVSDCNNSGEISFTGDVKMNVFLGGIIGIAGAVQTHTVSGCTNEGIIKAVAGPASVSSAQCGMGGITGPFFGASITDCINKAPEITASLSGNGAPVYVVGGVAPGCTYVHGTISGCKSEGKINVTSTATAYVGGVMGQLAWKSVTDCSFDGEITTSGDNISTGGLAGACVTKTSLVQEPQAIADGTGLSVKALINVSEAAVDKAGMVVGLATSQTEAVLGNSSDPVKVSGSINGAVATADDLKALGSASTGKLVITAALAE